MAVTIKDVAKKAGVSYSTVSRALNDPNADKSDKKKRILKIAEEMGYVPNQAAIQLKMSRSYVIGLYFSTISKMSSPFVLHDVLTGVYSVVGSKYNVIVKGIDMHEPGTLNPSFLDGIIVLTQKDDDLEFMDEVLNKGIPMVAWMYPTLQRMRPEPWKKPWIAFWKTGIGRSALSKGIRIWIPPGCVTAAGAPP